MFFNPAKANTQDRSPYGSFWFSPVGSKTTAGVRVSGDTALTLTAVWACVRNISEDFAKLPFYLYKPRPKGGKDEVKDHWLYRLFAKAPNDWQTPFEWREMLQGHLELRGNAFNRIIEDGRGGIAQLIPLHPDRIRMELLDGGGFRYRYNELNGQETILRRDQVWHIRGLSSDGYMGYNPIQIQRQMLGVAISRQEYAARFFANDAKPTGGWIEFPGKFADAEAKTIFRDSWKKVQGGKSSGSVAVLDQGMKYHEIGFNNKDSQFIEASGMSITEVARMFRCPPHKIGDLSRATFGNIEQQNIEYATDCIQSRCVRWESSIVSQLLGPDSDLQIEFDISSLMRGDMAARTNYINSGVMNGTLTRNEGREMEGRNPIEGLDEPLQALNMIAVDDAAEAQDAQEKTDPQEQESDNTEARFKAIVKSNAIRMAARLSKSVVPSAILSDAMAISVPDAEKWLESDHSNMTQDEIAASLETLALKENK